MRPPGQSMKSIVRETTDIDKVIALQCDRFISRPGFGNLVRANKWQHISSQGGHKPPVQGGQHIRLLPSLLFFSGLRWKNPHRVPSPDKHVQYVPGCSLVHDCQPHTALPPGDNPQRRGGRGECAEPHPEAYYILCSVKKGCEKKKKNLMKMDRTHPENLTSFRSFLFSISPLKFANERLNRKDEAALNICPQVKIQHHKPAEKDFTKVCASPRGKRAAN